MIGNRIKILYNLESGKDILSFAGRLNKTKKTIYDWLKCETTPPPTIIDQIALDFDGKEGRPLISWDWLFTGVGNKFKNMEELPPDPPKKIKEDDEISFKELILQKLTKVESELKDLKSSQFNDRMTITGIGAKVQGIEEVVSSLNLGKLNTDTKESKFTPCKTRSYKPSMVINLSKIG